MSDQKQYRPDVDGLRAVAVLAVVFYHAGFTSFGGGYVGVDVFFVISGYLITSIIHSQIESGKFSLANFYERRCRRILPALTAVVIFTVVGAQLLHPKQVVDFAQSLVATAVFSSNILFYIESGYFDTAVEFKPLLHTWSLAVEEQFYIFFPLLLLLIAKYFSGRYAAWLSVIAAISLVLSIVTMWWDPSAAFYLIPTRAWELLLGSLLAIGLIPDCKHKRARDLLSLSGFLLIAYSVFFYTKETAFPGVAAIPPTFGTALIIYAGINGYSFFGKILSLAPIVFIGRISYSLYLWHWPIFVFTKYYLIHDLAVEQTVVMLGITFLIAVVSWRYVEEPFRSKRFLETRTKVFASSVSALTTTLVLGLIAISQNGFPNRYDVDRISTELEDPEWDHWGVCSFSPGEEPCGIGSEDSPVRFILWGDSHAKALASGVNLAARKKGLGGKFVKKSGCPPLGDIDQPNAKSCDKFNTDVLEYISRDEGIEVVILAARWAIYAAGTRYKQEKGEPVTLQDLQIENNSNFEINKLLEAGLRRTVSDLRKAGKTIILVGPIPEVGFDVPSVAVIASRTGRDVNALVAPSIIEYQTRVKLVSDIFGALTADNELIQIYPSEAICQSRHCLVSTNGNLLYRDNNHLSTFGSKYLAEIFYEAFSDITNLH